ncbi:hypothetical protein FG386_001458 [Cryptosporidium ryanae]|uniref:uncharacterized protein n=1 Tax=Cryptosporidium ryanae TaxID=515981 RepID=UPI00351A37A4|nr:hypothetical protein FG386_001458 [Cryptosporidium ryanae]
MGEKTHYRKEISRLARENTAYRDLLLGTSKLVLVLCTNLHLSPGVTLTSYLYTYKFWSKYDILETDRKFVAAAAVLLAWKSREDIEPTRSSRKLPELSRFLYRIIKASSASQANRNTSQRDLSSSSWIYKSSGREYNYFMEQIKTYEFALLRAINFEITHLELPFGYIEKYTRILLYSSKLKESEQEEIKEEGEEEGEERYEYESLKIFRILSMSICLDLYRLPNACMKYKTSEVSLCSVWHAGIILSLPFAYENTRCNNYSWIKKMSPDFNIERVINCMNDCSRIILWLSSSDSA